jgi:hypothetical protein
MKSETKIELKNEGGMYTLRSGETLSCHEMAGVLIQAIEHYNNQIQSTSDARKIKKLKDKVRNIKLYVAQHDDIKQYMQ